jgi:hypothetical protein
MQIVNGMAPDRQPVKEVIKYVPTRLIALFRRLAGLQRGRYIIVYDVGEDYISWEIAPLLRTER